MNKYKFSILFIVTQIIYLIMIFVTIPNVMDFSEGNKLLDMMPTGYSFQYVKNLLSTLGLEGINMYLFPQLALDFIYPGLFIITYYYLFKLLGVNNKYILIIPIFAGIFDYIENLFLFIILKGFNYSEFFIQIMSCFSISKALFTTLTILIFLLLIIKIIYLKVKKL